MAGSHQLELSVSEKAPSPEQVRALILDLLSAGAQPSAWDLLEIMEQKLGWKARWVIKESVNELMSDPVSKSAWRDHLDSLTRSGDLEAALRGADAPRKEISSSIDSLLRHSKVY